jgi:hypothetical protein
MPTTPNYGWDTPADTDYVTNGALAIRTMANDADATVYSVQTTLDAEKVDKAGDFMTGPLLVLNNAAAGRGLGIQQDVANDEAIFQIVNDGGNIQQGFIKVFADNTMTFALTSNGNTLVMNNLGELIRTHLGESRPLPFAMQSGLSGTINAGSSSNITLDAGRFTQAPLVLVTPFSNSAAAVTFHVGTRTTSNFALFNSSAVDRAFFWQAIQMTSTSAAG